MLIYFWRAAFWNQELTVVTVSAFGALSGMLCDVLNDDDKQCHKASVVLSQQWKDHMRKRMHPTRLNPVLGLPEVK